MHSRELETLLDKQALTELVAAYCRGVDRKDFNLLRRLYHKDSIDDHGDIFRGNGLAFVDFLEHSVPRLITQHFIGNMLFVVEGHEAEGEIYAIRNHVHRTPEGLKDVVIGGRYLDRYVKEDGRWLFMYRRAVRDWMHVRPSHDQTLNYDPQRDARPDDASYRDLPALARLF